MVNRMQFYIDGAWVDPTFSASSRSVWLRYCPSLRLSSMGLICRSGSMPGEVTDRRSGRHADSGVPANFLPRSRSPCDPDRRRRIAGQGQSAHPVEPVGALAREGRTQPPE